MSLTEHPSDHKIRIQSVTADQIMINGEAYPHSVFITADDEVRSWNVESIDSLTRELLAPLLQGNPEVVLIGTGDQTRFLPPHLMAVFYERGIGVEVMTSAAAARTYAVLRSEDRKVGIGLMI